ncbi:MAG: type II toxin-antitoxin system VapC family toxin [Candidatus Micrarchaeota archaeon]|nr:type II toxin-antitoxin system VapC family toxin [Candidatus Micrarchaeota archaeon]
MVGTIIVDSNVLIFGESESSPEHALALEKYKHAASAGRIGINVIIVSEVFHQLQRIFGGAAAYARISAFLNSPAVDFLNITAETVAAATKLARDFGLRINDAIIAQQAIELDAEVLTDDIRDFGRVGAVKVIPLRQS